MSKKIGIKELVYGEFLKATISGKELPDSQQIHEFLLKNGVDKNDMVIKKIKNHYSFYKSKWNDIMEYGEKIFSPKKEEKKVAKKEEKKVEKK